MAKEMSRRTFLKQGAAAAIGLAVVPSTVLGKKFGYTAPSDKLNIAGVGVGGRGASVLKGCESQNIVALCVMERGHNFFPGSIRFSHAHIFQNRGFD